MATSFPVLKTGAVIQYPADRTPQFSTQAYRFVDGSEQRFPGFPGVLQQWTIKLDLLDEGELEKLREFFLSQEGRAGSFSFTDPWTGTVYSNCSFGSDTLSLVFQGPQNGGTQVVVKEIG
jgi:phage-related protein